MKNFCQHFPYFAHKGTQKQAFERKKLSWVKQAENPNNFRLEEIHLSREAEKILSISRVINMKKYFKKFGHTCDLKVELEGSGEIPDGDKKNWYRKKLLEWATIDLTSNLTLQHFNSFATAVREKKKHLKEHPLTIHPFSRLKMIWECVMIVSFLTGLIYIPLQYMDYVDKNMNVSNLFIMKVTKILGSVDMIVHFFSGYLDEEHFEVKFEVCVGVKCLEKNFSEVQRSSRKKLFSSEFSQFQICRVQYQLNFQVKENIKQSFLAS